MVSNNELKSRIFGIGMANLKTRFKKRMIDDIPIMITTDNYLLCLPSGMETKHVGSTGMTGCQPAGSKVLMANGSWENIERIKKGDLIISPQEDGSNIFTKVKRTTNWFSDENYEVKETNKRKRSLYKCSHNHLIPFYCRSLPRIKGERESKNAIWKIKHETAANFSKYSEHANTHIRAGFSSFLIKEFNNKKNCEIEPYTLGVFLGDGSFYNGRNKKGNVSRGLNITSNNFEILEEISKYYPIMSIGKKQGTKAKTYRFSLKVEFPKLLSRYGLEGKGSKNKFIPKEALLSNSEYRKKLLAGLIDTDGTLSRGYCYSITTISEQLSKNIEFLVHSLGGRCSIEKYRSSIKSTNFIGERYVVSFYLHKMELPLKIKHKIRNKKTFYLSSNRVAISVKKSNSCIVYGIEIDSPSKWYITDNWMITHNTCKSLFMNNLLGWDHWHSSAKCILLNDFQKETFEWSVKTEVEPFIRSLSKINAKPCPLPIVYVFPSTNTLQIEKRDKRFPYIKMTLPVEEVIMNVEHYHKLDRSKVYLANIKEELVKCDSIQEIRSVLEESFPEKQQKLMKIKLMNIFEDLFENNMLNVSVPEAPAFLEYQRKDIKYYNNTFLTLMRAGFIPSIQTSDLCNQEYFSAYIAFIVNAIYKNQYYDPYFKKHTVSLFVDEIDKLWLGHGGELIKKTLSLIGTNGRMARVGLRWATQNYEKVTIQIRANTKYLFVSRKSDAKEVNHIRNDFEIPKHMDKDILNLKTDPANGIFEIVALTTEKFILYDLTTGEKKWSSEPKKGTLICPMARHRVPNKPI